MKKKWLAVIPAVSLMAAPLSFQTAEAAPKHKSVHLSESERDIPPGYEAILNWPPHEQPIVEKGSRSFEVEFIQVMLNHFGFETDVDGIFGQETYFKVNQLQAAHGLEPDGIVGVATWTLLLDEYQAELFTVEKAIMYAEETLNNDDLVFSSDGNPHKSPSDGKVYYILKAQSKELIYDGGSGTVGYYNVYQDGRVVESDPK